MADTICISRQSYNYKENNKMQFTPGEIIKISRELNLTLEEVDEIFFDGKLSN